MTSILGISAFYHDSAAALIIDGKIIAAAQEERFTRKKHDPSYPFHAVDFVLKLQGDISPEDNFSIRAAIHLGDVVIEGDDIFGSGVNIASRIHGFTSPGNTIISDAVYKEVKNKSK